MNRLKQIYRHLRSMSHNEKILAEPQFFGGNSLNRVSFLRDDLEFIKAALASPVAKFIKASKDGVCCENNIIKYFNGSEIGIDKYVDHMDTVELLKYPKIVFLGIDENAQGFTYKRYSGIPYFAVEAGPETQLVTERADVMAMSYKDAELFSHSKMYLDWLGKFTFCPGCGSKMYPVLCGNKLQCSGESTCPVKSARVTNVCFPRTDPVIIIAIVSTSYDKLLLAKSKRWAGRPMYSTIAGFLEPAETVEDACKREIWEETGVRCSRVRLDASQPWPYPVNLMLGCIGEVEFNGKDEVVDLGHDPELLDAKWFDVADLRRVMQDPATDFNFTLGDEKYMVPQNTAVANRLIRRVVDNYETIKGLK